MNQDLAPKRKCSWHEDCDKADRIHRNQLGYNSNHYNEPLDLKLKREAEAAAFFANCLESTRTR